MSNSAITRREFMKLSVVLAGTNSFISYSPNAAATVNSSPSTSTVNWLQKPTSRFFPGATCGVFWPSGKVNRESQFLAVGKNKQNIESQSWPLAYWPDGSLKWTAHAFPSSADIKEPVQINPSRKTSKVNGIQVKDSRNNILVDTGVIRCTINKKGGTLIDSIVRNNNTIVKAGKLILLAQNAPDTNTEQTIVRKKFDGEITDVALEQQGPIRTVIKITGRHVSEKMKLIPFVVRLYFYRDSDAIRLMHTIVYDADENKDFIKGIGLTFDVPLQEELYNRHVRFVNSEYQGVFAEAVQGLTGLRRNPGNDARKQQIAGQRVGKPETLSDRVQNRLQYIPAFGDYTLFQGDSGSFTIRKRTDAQHGWIGNMEGRRSAGLVYLGTPSGGLAAGIRNFWQSYPAQLDVRNANTDTGKINLWLWSPSAPAMDLRFYHDGMGQDTYPKQLEGLEITYEDYEPEFSTPKGVARTSELMLWTTAATPTHTELVQMADVLQNPPTLMCDTRYLAENNAFGGNWKTENRSTKERTMIEEQLDYYFDYYKQQIEQHHWYGFWNYGDVMHTYDADRHTWRYDVGGYAWDNSELSTDLWLWYFFLHSNRLDVYRIAEAMTRHTGEVDVHHLGRFAPLGSRHNVMHWGCSAKQMRISTAANRRIYYFLTGDERVGDLMNEQVDAVKKLKEIVPVRKLPNVADWRNNSPQKDMIAVGFGTDWGAVAAAWLTYWERTEDSNIRKKLLNSMMTIAKQPKGFFTGRGWMDLDSGKFAITDDTNISVSHLSAVFGLAEICAELIALVDMPEFAEAWIDYCRLYNASAEDQQRALGKSVDNLNLAQGHSRLTAYAAYKLSNKTLAKRAWDEFFAGKAGIKPENRKTTHITGPDTLNPVDEDKDISTNAVAQWGLAAIQCLAYIDKYL